MKKITLLLCSLVLLISVNAQRVDLDKFGFTTSYRDFPEEPLPENYKTYNIRLEASPSLSLGFSTQNLASEIEIEGLKRVDGTGHITALVMLDDIIIEKTSMKERIQTSKDSRGVETKKSYFSTEMVYSFAARMTIYDYRGKTLVDNKLLTDRDNKRTFKTPETSSEAEANNYFGNKAGEIRNNLSRQLASTALNQAGEWLNSQYGYPVRRVNDILWILNNKRHNAYKDHQKAWSDFRNAIVLLNENESVEKAKEKMKPVIDYFEKVKRMYTTSDKEDRKMRYASYYNLAKIYICLDEPEKAMKEADALAMNDYDEKDGRMLRSIAEALAEKLRKNNATTRHFAVTTMHYESPVK